MNKVSKTLLVSVTAIGLTSQIVIANPKDDLASLFGEMKHSSFQEEQFNSLRPIDKKLLKQVVKEEAKVAKFDQKIDQIDLAKKHQQKLNDEQRDFVTKVYHTVVDTAKTVVKKVVKIVTGWFGY